MDILKAFNVEIPGVNEHSFDDSKSYLRYSKMVYDRSLRDPKMETVAHALLRRYIEIETKNFPTFSACVAYLNSDEVNQGQKKPFLNLAFAMSVKMFSKELDEIVSKAKVSLSYIGLYQFVSKYMLTLNGKFVETPEYTMMRVAISYCFGLTLTSDRLLFVNEVFQALCNNKVSAPSPTLFNGGRHNMQCVSCFLLTLRDDSMDGIFKTIKDCANISKNGGGVGFNLTKLRASGSLIDRSGICKGVPPVAHLFGVTSQYADQKGKRAGSFALWLEPWHADFPAFLELNKLGGEDTSRARSLHLGVWMNDEFMYRLKSELNGDTTQKWSFFCPDQCPGLADVHSEDFSTLYYMYEANGLARSTMKPSELWSRIITSVCETGLYMMFKDAVNRKSNEQNLGTLMCSNLCNEIVEFVDPDHTAVCVLSSFPLPEYVHEGEFDFVEFSRVIEMQVEALDNLIDNNYYPTKRSRKGAMRTRPLGLGVQGLAETFAMLGYAWGDPEALQLHREIFETMYLFANDSSSKLAERRGTYPAYQGSPSSNGVFQPDMWGVDAESESRLWKNEWKAMKERVKKHGLRNSQFIAPMPTASTSIIRNLTASFEPFTELSSVRKLDIGDFLVTNGPLAQWILKNCPDEAEDIFLQVSKKNSVQGIKQLKPVAHIYRNAFEIDQKIQLGHVEVMLPFIDQSCSHNLFIPSQTEDGHHFQAMVASTLFTSWRRGWKHGAYYTHIEKDSNAPSYKTDSGNLSASASDKDSPQICRMEPGCTACES